MMFTKRLREGVREGRITCSVRIWQRPHVKVGGIYPMEEGHILVESIRPIAIQDITGELARRSGFLGVVDLLDCRLFEGKTLGHRTLLDDSNPARARPATLKERATASSVLHLARTRRVRPPSSASAATMIAPLMID